MNTKHTQGAMRAAREIREYIRTCTNVDDMAEIIDRETAAPALLAACEDALPFFTDARCIHSVKWTQMRDDIQAAIFRAYGEVSKAVRELQNRSAI